MKPNQFYLILRATLAILLVLSCGYSSNLFAQYTTVGDAFIPDPNSDCVQLTIEEDNQVGCAYHAIQVDFNQDFIHEFTMYFGDSNRGADGMTLIYEPSGTSPCTNTGQALGYSGIPNSWIVEFDTFRNPDFNDPFFDNIEIHKNGDAENALAGANFLNIEDGEEHDVKILWFVDSQTFQVYFDGNLVISYVEDIVNNVFAGQNLVFFGHTAATGGGSNVHSACLENFEQNPTPDIIIEEVTICDGEEYEIDGVFYSTPGEYLKEIEPCVSETYVRLAVMEFSAMVHDDIPCNSDDPCILLDVSAFVTEYDLSINGDVTYVWSTTNGVIQSGGDTFLATVCAVGDYETEFIVDGFSCTGVITVERDELTPDEPIFTGEDICLENGNPFVTTYTAPDLGGILSYAWAFPVGATLLSGNTASSTLELEFTNPITGEICLSVINQCGKTNSYCLPISPGVFGCTNINSANYNSLATCDDGSCVLDCVELGAPIDVCGYEYILSGINPSSGTWSNLCEISDGVAVFTTEPDGSFKFEVTECGTYHFEYSVDDLNCVDKDTLVINFENNDAGVLNINPSLSIDYSNSVCHVGREGSTGCTDGNVITLDPVNPLIVEWNLCLSGSCNSENTQTQTTGENGCEADGITISTDTNAGIAPTACLSFEQADFVVNGSVDVPQFLEALNFDLALFALQFQCPLNAPCFEVPDSCSTTAIQNIEIDIPIQGKGFWTYNNQPLTDLSIINVNGQDYQLVVDLNACYYGPDPLTFTLLEMINGVPSPLTSDVTVPLQWQENWTVETVIIPLEVPVSNPNCNLCNSGYEIIIDQITAPTQPSFTCQPIDLIFHIPVPLSCDDNDCSTTDFYNPSTCLCEYTDVVPLNCDDNDCGTTDFYNPTTCLCEYTDVAPLNCDDNNCNTIDTYDPNTCTCEYEVIPPLNCDDDCPNTADSYNASTCLCENLLTVPSCKDSCDFTIDIYDENICECVNFLIAPICNDDCSDTDDSFNEQTCSCEFILGTVDCDDNNCLTADTYNIENCGCEYSPITPDACDDNCEFTTDEYDENLCECVHTLMTPDCDDGCDDTTDSFNETTCACENELVTPTCDDACLNTIDTYNAFTCACEYELVIPDCDDNDCQTEDVYDESSCSCEYTPITPLDCDDNCAFTTDEYDENVCECVYTLMAPDCDDGCDDTIDSFNETICACENELVIPTCDDACPNTVDTYNTFTCACEYDLTVPDCDDNDCLTADVYDEQTCACENSPITPGACDDGCEFTADEYDENLCECVHTLTVPNCDDGCDNTTDSFNEVTCACEFDLVTPICDDGCENTTDSFNETTCACEFDLIIPTCDDNNCLTEDIYNEQTCTCEFTLTNPIVCDDFCDFTIDSFDPILCECVFILDIPACDDGCDNTTDTFNETTCACEFALVVPNCDDACDNTIDGYNPLICACVHELVIPPCDDNCDNTIDTFNQMTCACEFELVEPTCDDNCQYTVDSYDAATCTCENILTIPVCDDAICQNGVETWNGLICDCEVTPPVFGCTDSTQPEYNPLATCDDNSCGCDQPGIPTGVQPVIYCFGEFVPPLLADDPGNGFEVVWQDEDGVEVGTGIILDPPFIGTYNVVIRNLATGCTSDAISTSATRIALPLTIILQDSATLDCISSTYMIDASGSSEGAEFEYQWEGPDQEAFSNTPTVVVSMEGRYTLTVLDIVNGCTSSDEIIIIENTDFPELIVAESEVLNCNTDEVVLSGAGSQQSNSITNYWIAPNGIDTLSNDITTTANEPGIYTFYGFDSQNNCVNDTTIEVQSDFVAPLADAGADIFLDCDQSLQTIGSENTSSGNSITVAWSTSNSDVELPLNAPLLLDVNEPGEYTLTVSDDRNGCFSTDIVQVFESENSIELTDLQVINPDCFGETGAIILNAPTGGTPPYLYAIDESAFSANNAFFDLPNGSYDVAILDTEGCEFITNVIIESPSELVLELGEDIFMQLGDSVLLTALVNGPIDSIVWISNDSLSCDNCLETSITPQNSTSIQAIVYDENGCIETDNLNIIVDRTRNIFIPNSFTPNADGINDLLSIYGGIDVEIINSFVILDRWGEQMYSHSNFQPNDPSIGWDGNLKGRAMNPGIFVYSAQITFVDGTTEIFSGDIALIR